MTVINAVYAWNVNLNNGNVNNNNRNNNNNVLSVSAFQPMYPITIESIYDAYFDTNRTTKDMVLFSLSLDCELVKLWKEIQAGTYELSRTKAFMVYSPKKREIFAMAPRDKVVNHWVRLRIEPLLEMEFSPGCYSCRKGKGGTAFARDLLEKSNELTSRYGVCYYAHLDVRNFFMSINRNFALSRIAGLVEREYRGEDKATLLWLLGKIFLFAPEKNFIICGDPHDWDGYPTEKSLRTNGPDDGLMMGSVNSQLVANYILTETDRYIAGLGISVFRYVDDLLLVHHDRDHLLRSIPLIEDFIFRDTGLTIHRNKRYFQPAFRGVMIIGYFVKAGRLYLSNRCVSNLHKRIHAYNALIREQPKSARKARHNFVACVNSYFGRSLNCRAYNIRSRYWEMIAPEWKRMVHGCTGLRKIRLNK